MAVVFSALSLFHREHYKLKLRSRKRELLATWDIVLTPSRPRGSTASNDNTMDRINEIYWTQFTLYYQCQYSKTWDSKCLALIAQMVRAFGINPNVGCSSPPQVEIFLSQKRSQDTFTRTPVRVSKMNAVAHAHLTIQMWTLLHKYICYLLHTSCVTFTEHNTLC